MVLTHGMQDDQSCADVSFRVLASEKSLGMFCLRLVCTFYCLSQGSSRAEDTTGIQIKGFSPKALPSGVCVPWSTALAPEPQAGRLALEFPEYSLPSLALLL